MAIGQIVYGSYYFGKWYTDDEAREVERDLIKNSYTGDRWYWKNEKGETVQFSS